MAMRDAMEVCSMLMADGCCAHVVSICNFEFVMVLQIDCSRVSCSD
jgi:hypothetical protein